jgi:pyruvate/2-oxoacid:ferredoxin oxidoreductase beta subunit/Pyruvate/2-oxoacid:ferredoxin oxidoreductase gamma subunit
LALNGNQVVIVSDIGCSGLFDTFFNTHAFHGLHGRALTYATGLKMARPDLHVIVTMGDGGLGIGGAHLLSACRRNLDLTLLVLNNFNYGMTGGQCSATTPMEARVGSGFLNRLEKPLDVCSTAATAGATYARRVSAYDKGLAADLAQAIQFKGFSLIDIWGVCPGRYTRRNRLTPQLIREQLAALPSVKEITDANRRPEYATAYRQEAAEQKKIAAPRSIDSDLLSPDPKHQEIVMLGSAGQRIVTAGELLCLAGLSAGMHATQKNDYPITVLRGHSISELVISPQPIDFTGIRQPNVILALADEGIKRREQMLANLVGRPLVLKAKGVSLPDCDAQISEIDFKRLKIKSADWALAALAILAIANKILTPDMLRAAIDHRFKEDVRQAAYAIMAVVAENQL